MKEKTHVRKNREILRGEGDSMNCWAGRRRLGGDKGTQAHRDALASLRMPMCRHILFLGRLRKML